MRMQAIILPLTLLLVSASATALPVDANLLAWWGFNNTGKNNDLLNATGNNRDRPHYRHLSDKNLPFHGGYYDAQCNRLYPVADSAKPARVSAFIDIGHLAGDNFATGYRNNWGTFKGTNIHNPTGSDSGGSLAITGIRNNHRYFQIVADLTGFRNISVSWAERRTQTGFNSPAIAVAPDGKNFTNIPISGQTTPLKRWATRIAFAGNRLDNAAKATIRFTLQGASSASGNVRLDNIQLRAHQLSNAIRRSGSGMQRDPNRSPEDSQIESGPGQPPTAIRRTIPMIQGHSDHSPYINRWVQTTGVITAVFQRRDQLGGFFIQTPPPGDNDTRTSDGIFVIASRPSLNIGNKVIVTARVVERGDNPTTSGTRTELHASNIRVTGSATPIQPTPLVLPQSANALERFEGMLVDLTANRRIYTIIDTSSLWQYGQLILASPDNRGRIDRLFQPTQWYPPETPMIAALRTENQRRRMVLDDGKEGKLQSHNPRPAWYIDPASTIRVGDTINNLIGILDWGRTSRASTKCCNYRLQAVSVPTIIRSNPRPALIKAAPNILRIASYNAQNYFSTPNQRGARNLIERTRQNAKITAALLALNADIIGLQEIENNVKAITELVHNLNTRAGVGTYAAADPGIVGTDRIKVSFLYRPQTVRPTGRGAILSDAIDRRAITTKNRPSVARSFIHIASGERLTVVVNHFKSKRSSCAQPFPNTYEIADANSGDGQGNCNRTRTSIARALADWIATDPTNSNDPDILIIGDLNAYAMEDPIRALENAGFVNLIQRHLGAKAYGYVFAGESGYLSHALANPSLAEKLIRVTQYHTNADESKRLDYKTSATDYYRPDQFRASDHDPIIVSFALRKP